MRKILVTGVAGFIGSHISKKFIDEGFNVVGIDDLSSGSKKNVPEGVEFINIDLADESKIKEIPKSCDLILHLAGQSSGEISFDNPIIDLKKNTNSTLNLIKYGISQNSSKFLLASSMSVYGNVKDAPVNENNLTYPLSCYGVGKLASEGYLNVYKDKLPYLDLRMFNVYGPGQDLNNMRQGMVSIFLSQALTNNKILIKGSLERYRDLIYISDVVESWYNLALNDQIENKVINVGAGNKIFVKDIVEKICAMCPNTIYEQIGGTPGDQKGIYSNNDLLKNLTGMTKFIDLEEGLQKFKNWAEFYIK